MERDNVAMLRADSFLSEGQNVVISKKTVRGFPLHWHDFFEIEILIGGESTQIINGEECRQESGSAYLVFPTDFHEYISGGEAEIINVTFKDSILSRSKLIAIAHGRVDKFLKLEGEELEDFLAAIRLLNSEVKNDGEHTVHFLDFLVGFFVKDKRDLNSEQLSGIKKALLYLEMHFKDSPSLQEVAKEAGFHPNYFSTVFKKAVGESFSEKLSNLKLEYSATLLTSGVSVSNACFESGFGSLSGFFTAFKKKYGVCPSDYKKAPSYKKSPKRD